MILSEITDFLSKIPPFQFLEESTLKEVSGSISMEFYPKGTVILRQDGPPSEFLRVIKKGGVKVYVQSGTEEALIDYRSEGDFFGILSLISGDKSRANVVAVEDTICYLIKNTVIQKLLDSNALFTEYFLKSFFSKFIDKTYKDMSSRGLVFGGGDKLLFSTAVGDVATQNVIVASQDLTIRETAEIMSRRKISAIVLHDGDGTPTGIVTDRDLRDKVVARGRDFSEKISNIMSVALIKSDAREYCFEALLKMIKYNIHHLLIVEEGKLRGILTNHDLMLLQGTSPVSIAKDIENAQSIDALIPVSKKINDIVSLLLKEGAKASNITRIITEINDRLVKKILEIADRQFRPVPVRYCWIAFGSEGRKEQTFKTDQDNAIIHEDVAEGEADEVARFFAGFASFVNDGLIRCGFPPCEANYMASNPQWTQPLSIWQKYFSSWISSPTPEAVLRSLIFFDFRPLHGEMFLAEDLRNHLIRLSREQNIFFAQMASVITKNKPPLGFFRNFIVEKSGEHKDELNLKLRGIGPLVDVVRLFALERGLHETSTLERIRALKGRHPVITEMGEEIEHAFEFITLLRIHHQLEQMNEGIEPDNFVNPSKLSNLERKSLKESFQIILRAQDGITETYRQGMVGN